VACETFCLDDDSSLLEATEAFKEEALSPDTVRFVEAQADDLVVGKIPFLNTTAFLTAKDFEQETFSRASTKKMTLLPQPQQNFPLLQPQQTRMVVVTISLLVTATTVFVVVTTVKPLYNVFQGTERFKRYREVNVIRR